MLTKVPIKLFAYGQFTKQIITFLKLGIGQAINSHTLQFGQRRSLPVCRH